MDKEGYVYWQDKTIGGYWQWDDEYYELLTAYSVRRAFVQDFRIVPETKKCDEKEVKRTEDIVITRNTLNVPISKTLTLQFKDQTKSFYDHSISWNVGAHAQVEAGVEPFKVTAGFSIDIGGSHGWGRSDLQEVTKTDTSKVDVPPGKIVKMQLTGLKSVCTFDYIATVELTYSSGESRVVKDHGTYKGVDYGEFYLDTDMDDI